MSHGPTAPPRVSPWGCARRRGRPHRSAFGYDLSVRSVADQLKQEDRARIAALSPEARVALSLRLGQSALRVLCAARGVSPAEAAALARAIRSRGRRSSCAVTG